MTYLWGLQGLSYDTPTKCPLGIYVSPRSQSPYFSLTSADVGNANIANTYIVNKVRVYFQISSQNFPSGRNWQMQVFVNCDSFTNIAYIDSSFSTNLPIFNGKRLICRSDETLMQISCDNIGDSMALQ